MTVTKILSSKGKEKLTMLTAYDYLTAKILSQAGIDMILVGDSLGTVVMGNKNTLAVTLNEIIYHTRAVRKGAPQSFIIGDMPFLSYGTSIESSVLNAGRIIKEGNANAVKLEGGKIIAPIIKAITDIGVPVMGHIGMKPQSVNKEGYRIHGKSQRSTEALIEDAIAIQNAGAFAIVIEVTTEEAAKAITEALNIPTIGIGAGRYTDGQVLVISDMLGLDPDNNFIHNKPYADLYSIMLNAVKNYIDDVRNGKFPTEAQTFHQN